MAKLGTALGVLALFSLLVIAGGLLLSLPVWLLWNYCLVGALTVATEITWLQAWGITVLCGFLFKSGKASD